MVNLVIDHWSMFGIFSFFILDELQQKVPERTLIKSHDEDEHLDHQQQSSV